MSITTGPLETCRKGQAESRGSQAKEQILDQRGIRGPLRPIPYKLALPIIENASLEDNDELQDLWAKIYWLSSRSKFEGLIRRRRSSILSGQLEVVDVHILNAVYESYERWSEERSRGEPFGRILLRFSALPFQLEKRILLPKQLSISLAVYENSIDNLVRVRCLGLCPAYNDRLFITSLGVSFVRSLYSTRGAANSAVKVALTRSLLYRRRYGSSQPRVKLRSSFDVFNA